MRRRYPDRPAHPGPRSDRPPWRRPGRALLVAGEVSARWVYRWLRRQRRDWGDVYLRVAWPEEDGTIPPRYREGDEVGPEWPEAPELPDPVWDALWAFELPCKGLDVGRSSLEVRTRAWRGSEAAHHWDRHRPHGLPRRRGWDPDRSEGLRYARLLARLLRAAHRAGVRMQVERT